MDFFLLSEIVTIWQTNGTAYKLKPRSFHKSTYLQDHLMDFHLLWTKALRVSNRTTLVLSNTRILDRELFYKLVYLI